MTDQVPAAAQKILDDLDMGGVEPVSPADLAPPLLQVAAELIIERDQARAERDTAVAAYRAELADTLRARVAEWEGTANPRYLRGIRYAILHVTGEIDEPFFAVQKKGRTDD